MQVAVSALSIYPPGTYIQLSTQVHIQYHLKEVFSQLLFIYCWTPTGSVIPWCDLSQRT